MFRYAQLLVALPLIATLFDEFMFVQLAVEDDEVHGELLRTAVGVEEMDREDESGGKQGLIGMEDGRNIEHPAGEENAEKLREPEHQAGAADNEHTPEDPEEVEFFPIGPALEGRFRSLEEEPADHSRYVFQIAQIRTERVRTEEPLQPVAGYIFPDKEKMDAHADRSEEIEEGGGCAPTVDQPCICRASEEGHERLGPFLVVELEGKSGQGKPQKTGNDYEMEKDVAQGEAAIKLVPIGYNVFRVACDQSRLFFPVFHEAAEHPEEGVNPEDGKDEEEQAGHEDEGIIEDRIFFPVIMFAMGIVCRK